MIIGVGVGIGNGGIGSSNVLYWTFYEGQYGVSQEGGFMFGSSVFNQDTTGAGVTLQDNYSMA